MTSNRCPDKWIVPAGGVEPGEQYHDAAKREVLEEVSRVVVLCMRMSGNHKGGEAFTPGSFNRLN